MSQRRVQLAPLEADAFLAWAWRTSPPPKGLAPLTVEDLWFELKPKFPDLTREEIRRSWTSLAARVRRNQRLGLGPWGDQG